jgi:putative addiction module component (TIGR02574 family)
VIDKPLPLTPAEGPGSLDHIPGGARGAGPGIVKHVTGNARKVLADALELSDSERSELITELAGTLPEPASDTLHPDWLVEIERRANRVLASPDGGIPWEDAEARLLTRRPG